MLIDSPKSLDKERWGDFRPLFESWPPSDLFPGLDVMRHVTAATDLDSETAKELLAHCYNLLSPTTRDLIDLLYLYLSFKIYWYSFKIKY